MCCYQKVIIRNIKEDVNQAHHKWMMQKLETTKIGNAFYFSKSTIKRRLSFLIFEKLNFSSVA